MKRIHLLLVAVFATVLLTLLVSPSSFAATPAHRPFGEYHVVPQTNILYPRIGAPVIAKSGSSFSVYLRSDVKDASVWKGRIQSLFDAYDLTVEKAELENAASEWTLTLRVPTSALRSLYNLTIYAGQPSVQYSEANSVFVVGPSYPSTLRVAVISDTHYGIVSFYEGATKILRRTIDALNAIRPDLVIGTGDMTDATVEETVFSAMRTELTRLHVPILLAPGNNDYQSVLRGQYLWEKYLAPNSASLDFGAYRFVSLDSQMGSISDEQLRWVEEDLASAPAGTFKVLVIHHPYWGEVHASLNKEIPKIISKYGVGLVLSGHLHADKIEVSPTLSIVTTSLSTSDQFVGYRLLTLKPAGVEYTPNSLPYTKIKVTYLQGNDYSSTGGAVLIENGLDTTLNFTLTFLLRNSATPLDLPHVEGGSILRSTSAKGSGSREVVELLASVEGGQRRLMKAYYEVDSTPPSVSLGTRVEGATIFLDPSASDVGLGVLSLTVFHSEDNKTWVQVLQTVIDSTERWVVTSRAVTEYFKVEAEDAAGLKTVGYARVEVAPTTTVTTQTSTGQVPGVYPYYIVVAVFALVVLVVFAFRRRGKPRASADNTR